MLRDGVGGETRADDGAGPALHVQGGGWIWGARRGNNAVILCSWFVREIRQVL